MKTSDTLLFQSVAASLGKKAFQALVDAKVKTIVKPTAKATLDLEAISLPLPVSSFAFSALRSPARKSAPGVRLTSSPPKPEIKVFKVGIWDVNSMVGDIELVINTLNAVQKRFCFFEVAGAVPAGLISDKTRVIAWLAEHDRKLTAREKKELEENTIAEDFYPQARKIRLQMSLDHIIGLTRSLIAFEDSGRINFNYFATFEDKQKREILVSTYDLRRYAAKAERPLEAAIGIVLLGEFLVAMSPHLDFHENTGCLFDFNEDRDSIVATIRAATIETGCLKKIRPDARQAAEAMIDALRKLPVNPCHP